MSLFDFEFLDKLGDGAYSSVFRVKRKSDAETYALKKVKFGPLKDKEKENALNEVRLLASVSHPNIIGYKQAFIDADSNSLCIVMEYADGGDLLERINQHKRQRTRFTEEQLWQLVLQMAQALKQLHDLNILHRDLKCANVLLCKNGAIKLGDLNVSKVSQRGLAFTQTGTPCYASPEVWKDMPYDSKSDIWSMGCVLYEAATLNPPFKANNMDELFNRVTRGQYAPIPSSYSGELRELVSSLLQVSPRNRPSCDELLRLPTLTRHISHKASQSDSSSNALLGPIELPQNILMLSNKLPGPNYGHSSKPSSRSSDPISIRRELVVDKSQTNPTKLKPRLSEVGSVVVQPQPVVKYDSRSDRVQLGRNLSVKSQDMVSGNQDLDRYLRDDPMKLPPLPKPVLHKPSRRETPLANRIYAIRAEYERPAVPSRHNLLRPSLTPGRLG